MIAAVLLAGVLPCIETNSFLHSFHGRVFGDIRTAYQARGKIVDIGPSSLQGVDLNYALGENSRFGGNVRAMSSLADYGQAASRRHMYNKVYYNTYASYSWKIVDGCRLDNRLALQWVTFPGYEADIDTLCEWQAYQALRNKYITPYYLLRRSYSTKRWCYWMVGVWHGFELTKTLSFKIDFHGDLGNSPHFMALYGPREGGGGYPNGLAALNVMLRLDWRCFDWLTLCAMVHQFDMVMRQARDKMEESSAPESVTDLTIGYVGAEISF